MNRSPEEIAYEVCIDISFSSRGDSKSCQNKVVNAILTERSVLAEKEAELELLQKMIDINKFDKQQDIIKAQAQVIERMRETLKEAVIYLRDHRMTPGILNIGLLISVIKKCEETLTAESEGGKV